MHTLPTVTPRPERVRLPVMGETNALSTTRSVPQPGRQAVRAKVSPVYLFRGADVPTMEHRVGDFLPEQVAAHPTPMETSLVSASATTMTTAPVVVRTLTSRPVAMAVAGERVDGAHGVRAVSVVVVGRKPARIAVMVRCKRKPAISNLVLYLRQAPAHHNPVRAHHLLVLSFAHGARGQSARPPRVEQLVRNHAPITVAIPKHSRA